MTIQIYLNSTYNSFPKSLDILFKKLIVKILDIGIEDLNLLFDGNPFLLNVDYKEIDRIYKRLEKEGKRTRKKRRSRKKSGVIN